MNTGLSVLVIMDSPDEKKQVAEVKRLPWWPKARLRAGPRPGFALAFGPARLFLWHPGKRGAVPVVEWQVYLEEIGIQWAAV